jgi:hypothetical protein
MEEMTEIPKSLLWGLCDKAVFAGTFQAAIEFELIVLEWAFCKGYPREIRTNRKGKIISPTFSGALNHLKQNSHISESLITQIEEAWDTRNDLMHDFAWKSLLLGPEQSRDLILHEAHKVLRTAQFAVDTERCRNSP